jgi:lysozyme family protein
VLVNIPVCEAFTSGEEGPYTNDPRDSGNWSSGICGQGTLIGSNKGCGAPATIAYVLANKLPYLVNAAWMQALPDDVYTGMFETGYWNRISGDDLPSGLDLSGTDFGWNTGPGNAAFVLQGVVGATQDLQIGPKTLAAIADPPVNQILARMDRGTVRVAQAAYGLIGDDVDGVAGPITQKAAAANDVNILITVIAGFSSEQMIYYRSLSNWGTYGAGWTARTGRRLAGAINLATAPAASPAQPAAA